MFLDELKQLTCQHGSEIEVAVEIEFKIEITVETKTGMIYPPFGLGCGQKGSKTNTTKEAHAR